VAPAATTAVASAPTRPKRMNLIFLRSESPTTAPVARAVTTLDASSGWFVGDSSRLRNGIVPHSTAVDFLGCYWDYQTLNGRYRSEFARVASLGRA